MTNAAHPLQTAGPARKTIARFAAIIFLFCFGWMFFLTQGLPIGDPDDWDHVLAAQDTHWEQLTQNLLTPWSTSKRWTGQDDRYNEVLHKRVFLTFVLKSIESFAGLESFPYYLLSKILFFSTTATLLFLLLIQLSRSHPFALGGTLFYLLTPAHYPHLLWITDPITMVHCLMLCQCLIFFQIVKNLNAKGNNLSFLFYLGTLAFFGFFAMKAKEPAMSMPIALGAFTLIMLPRWKSQPVKILTLLGLFAFFVFMVVPVGHVTSAEQQTFKYHISTIIRMFFRNFSCGYQDELRPAFFDLSYVFPVSISRSLGFFMLWTLVSALPLYWFQKLKSKALFKESFISSDPRILIFIFWLMIEIPLMGFFQPDPRYFSGTMIPVTILSTVFLARTFSAASGMSKRILCALIIFSLLWASLFNLRSVVWLRQQIGQRAHRYFHIAEETYKDRLGKEPTKRELALYYSAQYIPPPLNRPRMGDATFFVNLGYDEWNRLGPSTGTVEDYEKFAKQGYVYFITDVKDPFAGDNRIALIKTISGINQESLFEKFLYQIKKDGPAPFYIYKWIG